MKIRTTNTILYCKKWAETVAFYKTALALAVVSYRDWFVEFRLTDTACLSIADAARTSVTSGDGKGLTISINVDDIGITRTFLVEAGLTPTAIKNLWGSSVIYINDPEGNRLEFWS